MGLGPEIGNIDTGGSVWGGGYGQIQVIGYVNIVVPGEGLKPEIGNVETLGVWGHTLGMLISGGGGRGGAGSETDMAIWGMFILWGGWGSFGTNIGYVNIVGGLGQSLGMLIFGGPCGGFWTDIGYVNIVGPGKGKGGGGVGGQTLGNGDVNIGGGLGTEMGMPILWVWGVLGYTLGMLIF